MKRLVGLYIAWLISAVMLVLAIFRPFQVAAPHASRSHRYHRSVSHGFASDFYTLLRWVCCAAFVYSAVTAFRMKRAACTACHLSAGSFRLEIFQLRSVVDEWPEMLFIERKIMKTKTVILTLIATTSLARANLIDLTPTATTSTIRGPWSWRSFSTTTNATKLTSPARISRAIKSHGRRSRFLGTTFLTSRQTAQRRMCRGTLPTRRAGITSDLCWLKRSTEFRTFTKCPPLIGSVVAVWLRPTLIVYVTSRICSASGVEL